MKAKVMFREWKTYSKGKRNKICASNNKAGKKQVPSSHFLFHSGPCDHVIPAVMLTLDCQFDWIWDQLKEMSLSSYPRRISWGCTWEDSPKTDVTFQKQIKFWFLSTFICCWWVQLPSCYPVTARYHWHPNLWSCLGFQCDLKITHSPGIFQGFSIRFGGQNSY